MSDEPEDLPRSISQSTINLLGVDLVFHQLDDGSRVIEAESIDRLTARLVGGLTDEEAKIARTVLTAALQPPTNQRKH